MSDPFDGAGKPYKEPSGRAGILMVVGVIVALVVIALLINWGISEFT